MKKRVNVRQTERDQFLFFLPLLHTEKEMTIERGGREEEKGKEGNDERKLNREREEEKREKRIFLHNLNTSLRERAREK